MKKVKNYNTLAFVAGLLAGVFSLFVGFFFIIFSGSAIANNSTYEAVMLVVLTIFIVAAAIVSVVGAVFCYSKAEVGGWIMLVGVILVTIDIVMFLFVNGGIGGALALLLPEAFIVFASVIAIRTKPRKGVAVSSTEDVKTDETTNESEDK